MAETKKTSTTKKTVKAEPKEVTVTKPVVKKKAELDPHDLVTVRNGFNGKLIYIDKRTHEEYEWDEFGDEQDIELGDLKYAKSASKRFFTDNWFIIEDPEVIEYLGLEKYYKNALSIDEFEELFTLSLDEIKDKVSKISAGQKKTLAYMARNAIMNEELTDLKVIKYIEKSLGIELIER